MIKSLLRNIRQRSKSSRDNIAFSLAALFTALIFTVWLSQAPARYAAIDKRHGQSEPSEESRSPGFASFFSDVRKQVASLKSSVIAEEETSVTEEPVSDTSSIYIEPITVEPRASSSDKYTWPSQTVKEEDKLVSGSAGRGREVLIITTDSSSTTPSGQ
ncbi:hypothetical protein H6785_01875 [Candidatus Nomurabacteria bacterium]|nr:hypothetical protein [Candidatus Kaiserbacteria bacterium]MCB9815305.1 hypothetical protein [Candidatus Nomurabacteria bacterium]